MADRVSNNRLGRDRQIETWTPDSPQLRAEFEKLKRAVGAHPKGRLGTSFKITKTKKRYSTRPPIRKPSFTEEWASYYLFEFASGYALFHGPTMVMDIYFNLTRRYDSHDHYINHPEQVFTLKAFHPFSSTADALVQMIAISNSTVTPQLKSFLVDNLPKTNGKGSRFLVVTSNAVLAYNIFITTRFAVNCGSLCSNIMRGLRMKIDKFIDGLDPKDLEKQRLNLARLYSRQRCTTMVAKSSKAISSQQLVVVPRGRKRSTSVVVKSSKATQFVVVPHKFQGVFIAKGKEEDFICTRNLVPGEALYGEELISIQNEDGTDVEYRVWNPLRSKLAAAILCGVKNICVKPGSRILYLGDVCEITISHLSDLVGSDGLVYVVGISDVVVNMVEKRPNVITIIENPCLSSSYRMVLGMFDVIFADIAYPEDWIFTNATHYLRAGGHCMISTGENNINVLHSNHNYAFKMGFNPIELVKLEPIVRESVMAIGRFRVPEE